MKFFFTLTFTLVFSSSALFSFAQSTNVKNLVNSIDSVRQRLPAEKLFLQADRSDYFQDDTMWFKAYIFNEDYLTATTKSGILYVEIDDQNNGCIKRIMLPIVNGVSWGDIILDREKFPDGGYTVRCYTSWMRNFDENYIFTKQINIASVKTQTTLVSSAFEQATQSGRNSIKANIALFSDDKLPLLLKDYDLKVFNGNHLLMKSVISSGLDGKIDFKFDLDENIGLKNLLIKAQDVTKGVSNAPIIDIPITLNRLDHTDLQFMPESGNLVAGIPGKVGFKAIGENGRGVNVAGNIYDEEGHMLTSFRSIYRGIGSFELLPGKNKKYIAKLNLPNGSTKDYELPVVYLSGSSLKVIDLGDSLKISVFFSGERAFEPYNLIGQARGVICYAASLTNKNNRTDITIAKSLFPTGVSRFTLLNNEVQPQNERICFINHHDNLKINISLNQMAYLPHDSVGLKINVTDNSDKPVQGSFSIAVTNDSDTKLDTQGINIVNNLLLTSDLQGAIETPNYYLNNTEKNHSIELDNLMLTQGWVGYNWNQIGKPKKNPEFEAEKEFIVSGKVTNFLNKPIGKAQVILLSKHPVFLLDTLTNEDGQFKFKGLNPVDTAIFVIQAKNKKGNHSNIGIEVDEFRPPVFIRTFNQIIPWYVNSDSTLFHRLDNEKKVKMAVIRLNGTHVLQEVEIKDKKSIKGSHNLNGERGADQTFDEKDMEKAGKLTLWDLLLMKKINGYNLIDNKFHLIRLYTDTLALIIDGVNTDRLFFGTGQEDRYQFLKTYLEAISAEDVIGLEVMVNPSRKLRYDEEYYFDIFKETGDAKHAYLEITTRSGTGAFINKTPGIYQFKPLAFSSIRQFYSPRYKTNQKNLIPDLRSTIFWEPNVTTDRAGNGEVSFFCEDGHSDYTIVFEGSDFNGGVGYSQLKLKMHK